MNSKNKGKNGELEIANKLKSHGFNARRGVQYCGISGDADVIGLPDIHIEVKRVEKLNLDKAMEQSIADARENEKPVVFHRKNRKPWLVTMLFDDWMEMYKKGVKDEQGNITGKAHKKS